MPCNEGGPLDLAGAIRLATADPGGEAQLPVDASRRDGVPVGWRRVSRGVFQAFPLKSQAFHALARQRSHTRPVAAPARCSV